MARKLTDVDALFLGTNDVERAYIGDTLIWDLYHTVPELETGGALAQDVFYDWTSWSPPSNLGNLGTESTNFDLPADGTGLAGVKEFPAFIPGDYAYNYQGEIDPAIGGAPNDYERLVEFYPYLYPTGFQTFTLTNQGSEGAPGNMVIESNSSISSGADKRSMYFPGATTNYLSIPDNANIDLTTTMEITMRLSLYEVDNRLANQRIIAKSGTSRGYEVFLGFDTAHATINFTPNGTNINTCTEKLPFLSEHIYWLRVTYLSGTGSKFYWAPDTGSNTEPGSWTQLGGTVTTTTAASVANAETLKIGTYNGTSDMFKGRIYKVLVRNAETGGATVVDIDIEDDTASMTQDVTTTFTATSGQTVTLTKSGTPPNTVRLNLASSYSLQSDHRFGYGGNFAELLAADNQLHIIWVDATIGGYATSRREIYPVIRSAVASSTHYSANSWGMYFDSFQGQMKFTAQIGSSEIGELMSSGNGPVVGTGRQLFAVLILQHDGWTKTWIVRYDPTTQAFVYETDGGSSTPQQSSITSTGLISSTSNDVRVWAGASGFTINQMGIAQYPNVLIADQDVGWDLTSVDVNLKPIVESTLRVVASGLDASYVVGDFWRSSDDGQMGFATEAVEEGDIFAVSSASPLTFQQIKFNHPYRRKALYRPQYVTFGEPVGTQSPPFFVDAADDLFIWQVLSSDMEFEWAAYGYDSTTSAFIDMEISRDSGDENAYIFLEIDDDSGNQAWFNYRGSTTTDDPIHTIWDRGYSEPTLIAMTLDRGAGGLLRGFFYDATHGLTEITRVGNDLLTDDITMDGFWFFGPEEDEGYANALYYGGGWNAGVGIIPDNDGIVEYWERVVYGYPQG
jgi:hypothetical protein